MIKVYPESSKRITSNTIIHDYIHGGRGIVRLEAPSGTHHYYMFQKPNDRDAFPDDVIFVYAVHDFQKKFYIGMIEDGKFRLTRNSRFLPDTDIVKGAYYIMKMAKWPSVAQTSPMKFIHMGMCARCGRELSTDKSIDCGLGPKCRKKMEHVKEAV